MNETTAQLLNDVEREQSAVAAMIREITREDRPLDAASISAKQSALEPAMRGLEEATRRLAEHSESEPLPADVGERIESWRAELTTLLAAVRDQERDVADRRALVAASLTRLRQASKGLAANRASGKPDARFITKRA